MIKTTCGKEVHIIGRGICGQLVCQVKVTNGSKKNHNVWRLGRIPRSKTIVMYSKHKITFQLEDYSQDVDAMNLRGETSRPDIKTIIENIRKDPEAMKQVKRLLKDTKGCGKTFYRKHLSEELRYRCGEDSEGFTSSGIWLCPSCLGEKRGGRGERQISS